jgi:hypothetical protein
VDIGNGGNTDHASILPRVEGVALRAATTLSALRQLVRKLTPPRLPPRQAADGARVAAQWLITPRHDMHDMFALSVGSRRDPVIELRHHLVDTGEQDW